jgi:gentisate 1,2-dioxygenase
MAAARRYSRIAVRPLYRGAAIGKAQNHSGPEDDMALVEDTADPKHNLQAARQAYYERISGYDMAPLWEKLRQLVSNEPKTQCAPAIWRFRDVKAMVMESAELISAKEAERRVLVLENPALRGQSRITQTLYAGLQLIMPGEIAPAHRHTASAIRFIVDGNGAYTAVEGERTYMSPGDFVLTANWTVHDHGNTSEQPMIWLDVLDLPTVNFFDSMFAEHLEDESQTVRRQDGDSAAFFASGVLPDGAQVGAQLSGKRSPVVNYTYARTRPILERLYKAG